MSTEAMTLPSPTEQKAHPQGSRFLSKWTLLVMMAWFIGGFSLLPIGIFFYLFVSAARLPVSPPSGPDYVAIGVWTVLGVGFGLAMGIPLGGAQWLSAPRLNPRPWMLASALGGLIGGVVWILWMQTTMLGGAVKLVTDQSLLTDGIQFALLGITVAAPMAVLQWLVLRRHVAHSGWWVLASVGSSALGWAIVPFLGIEAPPRPGFPYSMFGIPLVSLALVGAVYAAITGLAMLRLLRHPLPPAPAATQETPPQPA